MATAPVVESSTLSRIPGSRVWIRPTVRACSGARRSIGPPLSRDLDAALYHGARRGEGDHLDRRHHLARLDQGVGCHGAERHGLIEKIEPVHPRIVDRSEAVRFGKDVAAAGEGVAERESRPADRAGDGLGGLVLAHVLGFQTGAGDGLDLRLQQHGYVLGRKHAPLLEGAAGQAHAVGEDQPLRLCDRHVAERSWAARHEPALPAGAGGWRRT